MIPPGPGQLVVVVNPAGQLLDAYVEQSGTRIRLEPVAVERVIGVGGTLGRTVVKLDDRSVRWIEAKT